MLRPATLRALQMHLSAAGAWLLTGIAWAALALVLALILPGEAPPAQDMPARVRAYTRGQEFDFVGWTAGTVAGKLSQASLGEQRFLTEADRGQLVRTYFTLRRQLDEVEGQIAALYADPAVSDAAAATAGLRAQQATLRGQLAERQPLAEAILQDQVAAVFAEQGLALGGQLLPPVAFHFTPLPLALVISPRDHIEQTAIQMIDGGLTLDQQVALEQRTAQGLDVSAFVTPVGGIGTYPTMVAQSSDLNWVAAVVAHEWAHNYLTLRPLGILYDASPELRILNETVAELAGNEIGALVMRRFYPDLAPPPAPFRNFLDRTLRPEAPAERPSFDFRAEMRRTRVRADELLAAGQIEAAEAYMEQRRQFFWDNGYRLRKLNQAYFAFYGAYNAAPGGGASGADPIGPAVRLLRRRSLSAVEFLRTVAWFTNVRDLRTYLGLPPE
ncbi:MAG: hypothetical protein JNK29_07745 [Anaerolineales bacterium]|nr:hypothetical protein [Anaerolineales bacterium]